MPHGLEDLRALRELTLVGQRASFDWVVSRGSIGEALRKRDGFHAGWVFEMAEYATWCLEANPPSLDTRTDLSDRQFGYLSGGDRRLLEDALRLGCGGFLTTDRRLRRNAEHMERAVVVRIMTPPEYWKEVEPWSMLFC